MDAALSFADTVDAIGRYDAGNYSPDRHGFCARKQEDRERVLDFILSHHQSTHRLKLLSLPGVDWTFEHMLLARKPMSQVVGLERSFSVYARSRRAIPTPTRCPSESAMQLQDRVMSYGTGNIVYSRVAANRLKDHGLKRSIRSHRLLLIEAATFASVLATDYRATKDEKKEFYERFGMRNAVWLDFTSSICSGVTETMRNLPLVLLSDPVPVCITIRNGRDSNAGVAARIALLEKAQPLFKTERHWTYVGGGNSSMLTVCGVIA